MLGALILAATAIVPGSGQAAIDCFWKSAPIEKPVCAGLHTRTCDGVWVRVNTEPTDPYVEWKNEPGYPIFEEDGDNGFICVSRTTIL
jgi:hypothetical protein